MQLMHVLGEAEFLRQLQEEADRLRARTATGALAGSSGGTGTTAGTGDGKLQAQLWPYKYRPVVAEQVCQGPGCAWGCFPGE